jgi:hypothetical protein
MVHGGVCRGHCSGTTRTRRLCARVCALLKHFCLLFSSCACRALHGNYFGLAQNPCKQLRSSQPNRSKRFCLLMMIKDKNLCEHTALKLLVFVRYPPWCRPDGTTRVINESPHCHHGVALCYVGNGQMRHPETNKLSFKICITSRSRSSRMYGCARYLRDVTRLPPALENQYKVFFNAICIL